MMCNRPYHMPYVPHARRIAIKDRVNPARVKVSGSGIDPKEGALRAGKPAKFSVDARGAGEAPLEVKYAPLSGASGSRRSAMEQQADVRTHGDGLFDVVYYPQTEGRSLITLQNTVLSTLQFTVQ